MNRPVLFAPESGPPTPGSSPQPVPSPAPAAPAQPQPASKITAFGQALSGANRLGGEGWKRKTNTTGSGATHVKSFHCKLTGESLEFLDKQINEWLDAHPDYEVKLVTSTVGEWTGKMKEPNLIIQVWV